MRLEITEKDVQAAVKEYFEVMGCLVLVNTVRLRGRHSNYSTGQSKGIPDLSVRHPKWPAYTWIGVEVKVPGKWQFTCDEQRNFAESEAVCVVHSVDDAVACFKRAMGELRAAPEGTARSFR